MSSAIGITVAPSALNLTIVLAVLCMLLVFSVQSWLLRAQHQKQFEMAINDVANTSVPLLAVALWDIETQAIAAQLQRITQKPEIGYARLQAAGGQRFEAGNPALLAELTGIGSRIAVAPGMRMITVATSSPTMRGLTLRASA